MVVEDPVGLLFEMTDVVWAVDAATEIATAADKFENGQLLLSYDGEVTLLQNLKYEIIYVKMFCIKQLLGNI